MPPDATGITFFRLAHGRSKKTVLKFPRDVGFAAGAIDAPHNRWIASNLPTNEILALLEQGAAWLKPAIVTTTTSNETIKQAMMAGMGLAGLERHAAGLEIGLGLLRVLDVHGSPWMRTGFIAHRRSMPLLPVHARLKGFILAEGRGVVAEVDGAKSPGSTSP